MLFNSVVFLIVFLPLALLGYQIASLLGRHVAGVWLILMSVLFYGWERPSFIPVLLVSMTANFIVVNLIARAQARPALQNWILGLGIAADLATLVWFKYLYTVLNSLAGIGVLHGPFRHVTLPLGISFFTFTQIGYLIDYRQGVTKDRGLLNYLLFVSFFPHLIAGPILHNREIMPQFGDRRNYGLRTENLAIGFTIFIIGLGKKCLLADPLSTGVIAGFSNPGGLGLMASWHVALAYTLQLYFDFSGYSDMAIGLARLFNIRFPLNFNSPYKAGSIIDYWQRWHMTLTRYLTLYLFNPAALWITRRRMSRGLGVGRRDMATPRGFLSMLVVPTLYTMGLAGIWHGAGSQFVIFGLLHGCYLSVNHGWRVFVVKKGAKLVAHARPPIWTVLLTYFCVLVASIFFRSTSSAAALTMLWGMLGGHGVEAIPAWPGSFAQAADDRSLLYPLRDIIWLAALYAVVWGMPNTQQIMLRADPALGKIQPGRWTVLQWRPSWQWALLGGATAVVAVLAVGGMTEFLYFQF